MKKVFYAVMFLLGLSIICSCNKDGGGSTRGNLASTIVGDWVFTDMHIDAYFNFSQNGRVTRYDLCYEGEFDENAASFSGGTLYGKPSVYWDKGPVWEYSLDGNDLFTAGMLWGTIRKVNNDKFIIDSNNGMVDYKGSMERIKSFKTKE